MKKGDMCVSLVIDLLRCRSKAKLHLVMILVCTQEVNRGDIRNSINKKGRAISPSLLSIRISLAISFYLYCIILPLAPIAKTLSKELPHML